MTVLDHLVLRGWLRPLAPRLASDAPAACEALAVQATAVLAPAYGGRPELAAAVSGCFRRAVLTGMANVAGLGGRMAEHQKRVMGAEQAFQRWIEGRDLEALADVLRGARVPSDDRVVAETLEAWEHLAGEVLPRSGPSGVEALARLLERGRLELRDDAARAATRDLAGAYSLLGERERAITLFDACDPHRATLERADVALEAGRIDDAEALARQALAAEEADTRGAAHRRLGSAAARDGRMGDAEQHFREALDVAREGEDGRGEAEALEELSEIAGRLGQLDRAVALLGELRKLARRRVDLTDEARALSLAGRLLCERGRPGEGLVMLAQAKEWADLQNPELADLVEQYVVGFQYTLTQAEWVAIQPLLEGERRPVIERAFAASACRAPIPPWESP